MDVWKEMRAELKEYQTNFEFMNNIAETIRLHPEFNIDSLSKGQLCSKIWLIKELKKLNPVLGNVYLLCGWYAIVAEMLFENTQVNKIYSFDIDPLCTKIADELHVSYVIDGWRFKSFAKDVNEIKYIKDDVDTVINTSCEHLEDDRWFERIPEGTLVILQSSNGFEIPDHTNCVGNLEGFLAMYPLGTIYYKGSRKFQEYTRYMIMGTK